VVLAECGYRYKPARQTEVGVKEIVPKGDSPAASTATATGGRYTDNVETVSGVTSGKIGLSRYACMCILYYMVYACTLET
jgi:hypothetical protein